MTTWQIRPARDDELDAVSRLLDDAWREYDAQVTGSEERLAIYRAYRARVIDVRSRLHESLLLVAANGDHIFGTVTYYPPVAEAFEDDWPPGWAGIRLLGVHPDARGAGIGRALTEECIRRARADGATHVGLHSTVLMWIARAMYERMDFKRYPSHDFNGGDDFIVEAYMLPL
jgi:ribosomal protein S18 acetylase RimI-like enzyme